MTTSFRIRQRSVDAPMPPETEQAVARLLNTEMATIALAYVTTHWAEPMLNGKDSSPAFDDPELDQAVKQNDRHDPMYQVCRQLAGRALARALLSRPPDWKTWKHAVDAFRYTSWSTFTEEIRGLHSESSSWLELLEAGPPIDDLVRAYDDERIAVPTIVEQWTRSPTAFDPQLFRAYYSPRGATTSAIALLRCVDRKRWFAALRKAKLPALVEQSFHSDSFDELLNWLSDAPVALQGYKETGHVSAVLLARKILAFPESMDDELQARVRASIGRSSEDAAADLDAFRRDVRQPLIDEAIAAIRRRDDGAHLCRVLFVERLERAVRQLWQPRDRTLEFQVLNCAADAARQSFGDDASRAFWRSVDGVLETTHQRFVLWLAAVFLAVPSDGPNVIATDVAMFLCDKLTESLAEADALQSFRDVAKVPSWVFPIAGLSFACVESPQDTFTRAFRCFAQARMRELLKLDGYEADLASRTLLLIGLSALANSRVPGPRQRDLKDVEPFASMLFETTRLLWLRSRMNVGGDVDNMVLYSIACLAAGLGTKHAIVVDALRYITSDVARICEVVRVWSANRHDPKDITEAFAAAGVDLEAILSEVAAGTDYWELPDETIKTVADVVAGLPKDGVAVPS